MTLETIQIPFGDRELPFSHPEAEAEMIRSVLGGEDYPLAATRVGSDAPVIIDVGSNCGAAAVFFKKHHPGARIICYEPSASTFELLNKNVEGIDGIETQQCSIWDKAGTFRLHHAPNAHSGAATLRPGDDWPSDLPVEEIATRTLSSELARLGLTEVHILKVDAETAEAEILQEVLTGSPDVPIHNIFVEYHGIAVRKFLTEELSVRYDVHLLQRLLRPTGHTAVCAARNRHMKLVKYIAWPSALLLAGCLHWPDAPETVQAPTKPEQVEEIRMQADGPLRARASTAYPQLTAWPSAEQAKLNKAIENRFAGHYKPAFTEMFRQAADAENEASSDPTLLGASFYDWVIEDSYETAHLSRWVVSIRGKRYEYTGGAHGNTTFFNANYWIRNGRVEPVRLGQIFKPMYLWQERVEQLIRRELKAQKALWLKDVTRKELLGAAFTFSKKGLEFHYHPYTVGPYTQGSFRVLLPMAEIRHLIFPGGPMSRLAKAK